MASDSRPQQPSFTQLSWLLAAVVGIATAAIHWPFRRPLVLATGSRPRFDLRPYLEAPQSSGLLSESLNALLDRSPWLGPVAIGLAAAALAMAAYRLAWARGVTGAMRPALMVGAALAALPATRALSVMTGGSEITFAILGLALATVGLTGSGQGSRIFGLLAAAAAVLAHPAAAPIAIALLLASILGGLSGGSKPDLRSRLVALSGICLVLVLVFSSSPGAPRFTANPLPLASQQLLIAPTLAADPSPRALMPTGYAALAQEWNLGVGAAVWAGLLLVGIVLAGWRMTLCMAAVTAATALALPFLTAGWVPGDRSTALLAILPLLALVPFFSKRLGTLVIWRDGSSGSVLGLLLIGALAVYDEEGTGVRSWLADPRGVIDLREQETDPVRLLLLADLHAGTGERRYVNEMRSLRQRIDQLLARDDVQILDRPAFDELYRKLLAQMTLTQPQRSNKQNPREIELLERLRESEIEKLVGDLIQRTADTAAIDSWYEETALQLRDRILPEWMELAFERYQSGRLRGLAASIDLLSLRIATIATLIGDVEYAIPLRSFVAEYRRPQRLASSIQRVALGIDLVDAGRFEEGIETLNGALPDLGANEPSAIIGRGARGRAYIGMGEAKKGLADLKRAWSDMSRTRRGLHGFAPPASRVHWQLLEIGLLRWLTARDHDPELAESARREFEIALQPSLAFGIRRVPQLLFQARLAIETGDQKKGRQVLEALRDLQVDSVLRRGDGALGRLDSRHWRREGLQLLLGLLGPDEVEERARIEQLLSDLRPN